jgi:hypothetical protein
MSFDVKAVADAIAVRFGPTVVTAPSGETNIQLATASLPEAITEEPTVLVFPPELDFSYGPSLRKASAIYPVRFYIYRVRDTPRNATLLNNWITALYAALDGSAHLGLSSYVNNAVLLNVTPGPLKYGEIEYHGLQLTVRVGLGEGFTATA